MKYHLALFFQERTVSDNKNKKEVLIEISSIDFQYSEYKDQFAIYFRKNTYVTIPKGNILRRIL